MGFSRQEYWSGLPCPPLGDLPDAGVKSGSLASPALAGGFFTTSATWKAPYTLETQEFCRHRAQGTEEYSALNHRPGYQSWLLLSRDINKQKASRAPGSLPMDSRFLISLVNLGALKSLPHLLGCAVVEKSVCVNHRSVWCIFSCICGIKKTRFLLSPLS